MTPEIVAVEWLDAEGVAEQVDSAKQVANLPDGCPAVTVGFLVRRTRRSIIVAAERLVSEHEGEEPTYRDMTIIPAGMVQRVTTLRKARV